MYRARWRTAGAALLVAGGLLATAPTHGAASPELAPRTPVQGFVPPPAGSYALPPIQRAPEGMVLDTNGRHQAFSRYTTGRVTLLSFMYTYCTDPIGCPLAYETMMTIRARLLARPELALAVRLVSLSFDPTHDDPTEMKRYAGKLADPGAVLRWHFLTTRSVAELKPMLDALGQDVSVELDDRGRPTRVLNHMLKLFLIDPRGRVREIYTTAYLLPEVMLNDIETLLLEPADR
ncbi:MAG: SCO family protein [Thauera phenolivorans]|uniref:SCO family protein n=1 Tax=Thauera phenolivorans TaxID=1792543 RepID=A0A7X7LVH6_9RHOO|nr:SCO family protein [Thauera phenolivorans]NLF53840.1 SCO family protein [Thauera phenolivorans]